MPERKPQKVGDRVISDTHYYSTYPPEMIEEALIELLNVECHTINKHESETFTIEFSVSESIEI
jgi:hypothetical protein